jgi:hypothetical protein|uniref:ATP synthase F0 subunit 8 n=1 Tax=Gomphonema parvulum TaxID=97227 RepID=UPI0022018A16|nr:ATP synthase F0 subunit 8 [Gomphonema parvulum]UXX44728.1 ATP synthase F0 subunit 8 [Gomphonema parvulum]
MAQFDSLIIFPLIWSLLLTLTFHYIFLLNTIIPNFFGVKKFREKKLEFSLNNFSTFNSTVKTSNSYNHVF